MPGGRILRSKRAFGYAGRPTMAPRAVDLYAGWSLVQRFENPRVNTPHGIAQACKSLWIEQPWVFRNQREVDESVSIK
jgi:hypothetical protein